MKSIVIGLLAFFAVTLSSTTAFAVNCNRVPAACVGICNRTVMTAASVACWCSGAPASCIPNTSLCAHASAMDTAAYWDLIACLARTPATPPATKPSQTTPGSSGMYLPEGFDEDSLFDNPFPSLDQSK